MTQRIYGLKRLLNPFDDARIGRVHSPAYHFCDVFDIPLHLFDQRKLSEHGVGAISLKKSLYDITRRVGLLDMAKIIMGNRLELAQLLQDDLIGRKIFDMQLWMGFDELGNSHPKNGFAEHVIDERLMFEREKITLR